MRRSCNATVEVRTANCLETMKRLHRNVTEGIKKLDEQKNCALTVNDIFVPSGNILRMKFKDYCERLILKDPVGNAHKTEELLWRKAFYDVVYTAKKLRKDNIWSDSEKALLSAHLTVGMGYYHHLILKLQMEYDLDLIGVVDFAFIHNESISSYAKTKTDRIKTYTKEVKQCILRLIHRSLVCLGDLTRYKLELDSNWDSMIANRYYKMAIAIDPNIGMPHNQLGTIASGKNYGLDGAYHYMRSILCSEPFEGAEDNLKRTITTYSVCTDENNSVHHCISQLFSLLHFWDYENPHSDKVNQKCQDLLTDIKNCLTMERIEPNNANCLENMDNIDTYLENCKNIPMLYLTDDMIFKIVTICLMSISRLKSKESSEVQGVVAITLAILSQLLEFTITRLQEIVIDMTIPDAEMTVKIDTYSSKLKDKGQTSSERKTNEDRIDNKDFALIKDNNILNLNENDRVKSDNGVFNESGSKKVRDKSKNLLSKLRRRKRRTSSDSDGSDIDQSALASSSDEINSDVSETEEDDALSEENDAISNNNTDDEESLAGNKIQHINIIKDKKEMNGHISNVADQTENHDKNDVDHFINGEHHTIDQQTDSKTINDKDSATDSGSTVTITTNTDSTGTFDSSNNHLPDANNTISYMAQLKKRKLKPNDILNMLINKEILASIKICCDWLRSNPDIMRMCAKSSRTLLKRVTILLNLIDMDIGALKHEKNEDSVFLSSAERLKECVKIVPLPEDIDLRGLNLLEDAHRSLDWQILRKHKINKRQETLLRALKLIEFGHHLSSVEDSGMCYDRTERLFMMTDASPSNASRAMGLNEKNFGPKGKLMRHMGKLWLKAEVRALESQVNPTSGLMSPYLVPDHEALAKHTPVLKRLVHAKKFVVVIPAVVVSALDEMKRVSPQAREATRWLEIQLKRGSRFLRAQRPNERLALPLIKGPRPKDKEAWLFFQIIECCHYLTQQAKISFTGDGEASIVTLLTGCNPNDRRALTFSPDGLAKSAGVNLEHIESFQMKWKSSIKSHG